MIKLKTMETKNKEILQIKAIDEKSISFYASAFNVIDGHNDITHKGTFVETKKKFEDGKHSIDLRIEHKETFATIGSITELEIDEIGLVCKANFSNSPIGKKAHEQALKMFETKKEDLLFSIGYMTLKESKTVIEGKNVRSLDNVELGEVSIVENPSNKEAKVLEVKTEEPNLEAERLKLILLNELNL